MLLNLGRIFSIGLQHLLGAELVLDVAYCVLIYKIFFRSTRRGIFFWAKCNVVLISDRLMAKYRIRIRYFAIKRFKKQFTPETPKQAMTHSLPLPLDFFFVS